MELRFVPFNSSLRHSASWQALREAERRCAAQQTAQPSKPEKPAEAVHCFVREGGDQTPRQLGRRLLLQALAHPSPNSGLLQVVRRETHQRCVALDATYRQHNHQGCELQEAERMLQHVAEAACGDVVSYLQGRGPGDRMLRGGDEEVDQLMHVIGAAEQLPVAAATWRQIRRLADPLGDDGFARLDDDVQRAWRSRIFSLCFVVFSDE